MSVVGLLSFVKDVFIRFECKIEIESGLLTDWVEGWSLLLSI